MKRTILYHRASALIATIVFAVGAFCISALAAGSDQVIDTGQIGSITIQKYAEEDELTPLSGVTFRYTKVADIVQHSQDGIVEVSYALDTETAEFLGLDEADVYDASQLDELLNGKTASQTEAFMRERGASTAPTTDADGFTTVADLPLGLYLICEYSHLATAVADADHIAPFFISVPTTAQDENGVFYWDYDVEASPKNVMEVVRNDKVIIGEGGNETKVLDISIGEAAEFLIRSDIPNAVGKLSTYTITDDLSDGLSYVPDSAVVYGVADDGQRTKLCDGGEFLFRQDDNLTWIFNTVALADEEGWAKYDSIEIRYCITLNEKAIVGESGNSNSVKTTYSQSTNTDVEDLVEVIPTEPCLVYTYALRIHKTGSDTDKGLPGATFVLEDGQGNDLRVTEVAPGEYCLDAAGEDVLTSDVNGNIYLKGLGSGTYLLRETGTGSADYSLLPGKVEIRIQSTENCYFASAIGTYAEAFPGLDYYTDSYPKLNPFILPEGVEKGTFINFGTADVKVLQEGIELELYEAKELTWSSNFPMDDSGVVQLEVVNNRISTPKTGDDQAFWVGVASVGAIGAGVTLYVLTYVGKPKRKKTKRSVYNT